MQWSQYLFITICNSFCAIGEKPIIKSCLDAYNVIRSFIPENKIALKEHMVVLYLNQAQRVIGAYKASDGGLTSTVGDLRLIFSIALKSVATYFIIGHNHPSGNIQPSKHDLALTLKLKEVGQLMDIKMMDHLIISPIQDSILVLRMKDFYKHVISAIVSGFTAIRICHMALQKEELCNQVGSKLRGLRIEKQLSIEKLAERAGLHPNYVGSVERGERNIALENILAVAKTLGWSPKELMPLSSR